jgi:hypothetical protein
MHQALFLTNPQARQRQKRQLLKPTGKQQILSRIRVLIGASIFWLPARRTVCKKRVPVI